MLILDYFIIIILYLKNRKIYNPKFFISYLIFFILLGIITVINNGDISTYILNASKYIMMFLMYNYCIIKYQKIFLKS